MSETTTTLASEAPTSEIKPFVPPQATEAQKLLATALKSGVEAQKTKVETQKTKAEDIIKDEGPLPSKVPKLSALDKEEVQKEEQQPPQKGNEKTEQISNSVLKSGAHKTEEKIVETQKEQVKSEETLNQTTKTSIVEAASNKVLKSVVCSSASQEVAPADAPVGSVSASFEVSVEEDDMSRRYSGLSSGKGGG